MVFLVSLVILEILDSLVLKVFPEILMAVIQEALDQKDSLENQAIQVAVGWMGLVETTGFQEIQDSPDQRDSLVNPGAQE